MLVAHNRYQSLQPSGENVAVTAEIRLLREAGVEVDVMSPSSDALRSSAARARAAGQAVWSTGAARDLRARTEARSYDVVHVHNVYPQLSPSIVREAARGGAKVVHTVHNYRLSCLKGTHFRDGGVCEACTGHRVKAAAVLHGCYRDSRVQSLPMVVSRAVGESVWMDDIDTYIALTPFMQHRLELEGVAARRIVLRPSWTRDPGRSDPDARRRPELLFAGRLDEAKGIPLLLQSWRRLTERGGRPEDAVLRVAGAGPSAAAVSEAAAADPSIRVAGSVDRDRLGELMVGARALVVPSLWFEGFPLVVVEAFARGLPIVVLDGGALASVVDTTLGWSADPSVESLSQALGRALRESSPAHRRAARQRYEDEHSPARALSSLLGIYQRPVQ
ncbi:glycosyltransferase [Nocardioides korecus]